MPSVAMPKAQPKAAKRSSAADDEAPQAVHVAVQRCSALPWRPQAVAAIQGCPDGSAVAIARDDGSIELWDPEAWRCVAVRSCSAAYGPLAV